MSLTKLLSGYTLGPITLKNRVVMAPMTRNRSIGNVPDDLVASYYAQRAEAGLIITEGTSPSPNGLGYARMPGIFSDVQQKGWARVADAVHKAGSRMFVQLMHTGRVGTAENLPPGARVLAPSAVTLEGNMHTDTRGPQPYAPPQAMTAQDIAQAVEEFASAAQRAVDAGMDGVELHGANGYLIEQFINAVTNQRTDAYGGSVENRMRFPLEVARAVAQRIGADRVGIRLSPYGANAGMKADAQTDDIHTRLAAELGKLGLAYLHVADHASMGAPPVPVALKRAMRQAFGRTFILSGGYTAARAEADLQEGHGDLVAFGRPFMGNPRLVTAFKQGKELRAPDFSTAYTPGPKGYTDYPLE